MNIGLYAKAKGLGIIPKSPHVRTAAVLAVLSNLNLLRLHAKPPLRQNLCYHAMREDLAFAQLLQQRGGRRRLPAETENRIRSKGYRGFARIIDAKKKHLS